MFTGLVETTGVADGVVPSGGGARLSVATPLAASLTDGESIAVNGVCLTVATRTEAAFTADLGIETMRATTLGDVRPGARVNLERSLRADARLGGHFVLGHVDGVGHVERVTRDGETVWIELEAPVAVARYLIPKGSVAVDGVSLTIARLNGANIAIQVIPYTLAHTALGDLQPGARVNVEADMIGKYVVHHLMERAATAPPDPARTA